MDRSHLNALAYASVTGKLIAQMDFMRSTLKHLRKNMEDGSYLAQEVDAHIERTDWIDRPTSDVIDENMARIEREQNEYESERKLKSGQVKNTVTGVVTDSTTMDKQDLES